MKVCVYINIILTRAESQSRTTQAGGSGSRGRAESCSYFLLTSLRSPTLPSVEAENITQKINTTLLIFRPQLY